MTLYLVGASFGNLVLTTTSSKDILFDVVKKWTNHPR